MSCLCRPLRKILNFEISPPPSSKPPPKNSFLQISPRALIRGFTVKTPGLQWAFASVVYGLTKIDFRPSKNALWDACVTLIVTNDLLLAYSKMKGSGMWKAVLCSQSSFWEFPFSVSKPGSLSKLAFHSIAAREDYEEGFAHLKA